TSKKKGRILSFLELSRLQPTAVDKEPKEKVFDRYQTLFLCLPLSKKMIIDIIVNKNPDRFCMIEKVKKTMAENR
ncbi:hypothetical protein RKZ44_04705, partial [Streptococcus pneumoniae]|nr:hypothetical protein [Streptococcus pneumoniae]MDS3006698.1 hypothetical protein [Streptococcus pneumoniae]